jgi:sec-independent protein translocase protein TatA|tara:strand:+ start:31246 stop:31404 length:159 start_codon:yes stop_codon:yes gene_type:complete
MGISFWQIVLLLLIVILVFGSKRLGSLGSDIGKALKGFKKEVKDDNDTDRNT